MIAAFGGRRPKERAPVHYQMKSFRLELATSHRSAALAELDIATRIDPQNPEILAGARRRLAQDDGQLERARRRATAPCSWSSGGGPDARESASIARSEVLLELSAIARRDGEMERAREILESAIEVAAQDEFEEERLEERAEKAWGRRDPRASPRSEAHSLRRLSDGRQGAGRAGPGDHGTRLGRPERALDARIRALALEPRSAPAHEAALSLARSLGTRGAVRRRRNRDGGGCRGGGRCAARVRACIARLGGVVEADVGDCKRAAELYERSVSLGFRSPEVLRTLDRLYGLLGDAGKQAAVLAIRIEAETLAGGPRAASDAVYRLATLMSRVAGDVRCGRRGSSA